MYTCIIYVLYFAVDAPIQPSVTLVRTAGPVALEVSWTYKGFLNNLKEYQMETQEVRESNVHVWLCLESL